MELKTASAIVFFAKKLEEDSEGFYERLAQRYTRNKDILLSFAAENKKNAAQIERTYFEVISDAIEGCFAFDINSDEYALTNELAEDAGYSEVLDTAIQMEDKIVTFYINAADQSRSLMADIPRVFTIIAKKKRARILTLTSLMNEQG